MSGEIVAQTNGKIATDPSQQLEYVASILYFFHMGRFIVVFSANGKTQIVRSAFVVFIHRHTGYISKHFATKSNDEMVSRKSSYAVSAVKLRKK